MALSGDPEDIYRTDEAVMELFPEDEHLHRLVDVPVGVAAVEIRRGLDCGLGRHITSTSSPCSSSTLREWEPAPRRRRCGSRSRSSVSTTRRRGAAETCARGKFRNNGQTCVCANRIYVQAGVYDAFAAKLKSRVEQMKVGDGLEDGCFVEAETPYSCLPGQGAHQPACLIVASV